MAAEKSAYPPQGPGGPMDAPPAYPGAPGPQTYVHPPAGGQPYPQGAPQAYQPGPQQPYPVGAQAPYPPGQQPYPGQPMMHQPGPVPPGGYMMGQPVSSVVVVQQQMFRQSPVNCVCPHCQQNIITGTKAEPGGLTWLLCAGICLFGFWLGCCFIPFCIDDCQDIRHSCPNCKNTIHVFKRL